MHIRNVHQIEALASPMRLAVIDAIEAVGPCTVAMLGRILGRRPDALYYHLRVLEEQGLVASAQQVSPTTYDVVGRPLVLVYAREKSAAAALGRLVAAMMRGAQRLFTRGLLTKARVSGARRELWAAQRVARLGPEDLERVNALLQEVLDTLATSGRSAGKLCSVTVVLAPFGK